MSKKTDDELIAQCEARLKALRKRKAAALRRAQTKRAEGIAAQADAMSLEQLIAAAHERACDGSAIVGALLSQLYEDAHADEAAKRSAASPADARAEDGSAGA